MASKQELEKQVEELTNEVAELKSRDLSNVVETLQDDVVVLTKNVQELLDVKDALEADLKKEIVKAKSLQKELDALKAKKASKEVDLGEDSVVFQGKKHKILKHETAKGLIEDVKKRFVDEDRTVLVIDRHGA